MDEISARSPPLQDDHLLAIANHHQFVLERNTLRRGHRMYSKFSFAFGVLSSSKSLFGSRPELDTASPFTR